MSLFSLLAALVMQHFRPLPDDNPWHGLLESYADFLERHFNAGKRHYGMLAWCAAMLSIFVPVTLVYWLLYQVSPVLAWMLNAGVLYFTLRFRGALMQLSEIQHELRKGDLDEARNKLGRWLDKPVLRYDASQVTKVAIERALLDVYRGLFAVVFWFLVLPGPSGALLYPAALMLGQRWQHGTHSEEGDFGWFAQRMFEWMDWVPQRLAALSFAVVGDFEDALFCWRAQAAAWGRTGGVLLASAAGALGVRLGDPLNEDDGVRYRPELGLGDEADAEHMQSTEGMVWRALVLWLGAILLLTLAGWIGG